MRDLPLPTSISRRTSTGFSDSHTYILDTGCEGDHTELENSYGIEHAAMLIDSACGPGTGVE